MDVPTSEVGYTPAMPRREDHEGHKNMWGIGGEKIQKAGRREEREKLRKTEYLLLLN